MWSFRERVLSDVSIFGFHVETAGFKTNTDRKEVRPKIEKRTAVRRILAS